MEPETGTELVAVVDGRLVFGHYRDVEGNRIEVYTARSRWVAFIGAATKEDQAKVMLMSIARAERDSPAYAISAAECAAPDPVAPGSCGRGGG